MVKNEDKYSGKKILVVTAHPDDETFGMGGTLAFYGQQGAEIHLVCATRGEAGEVPDGMLKEDQSIGELREGELRCAAEILGICEVHFLDYRDSGMEGSDDNSHPNALMNAPVEAVAETREQAAAEMPAVVEEAESAAETLKSEAEATDLPAVNQ